MCVDSRMRILHLFRQVKGVFSKKKRSVVDDDQRNEEPKQQPEQKVHRQIYQPSIKEKKENLLQKRDVDRTQADDSIPSSKKRSKSTRSAKSAKSVKSVKSTKSRKSKREKGNLNIDSSIAQTKLRKFCIETTRAGVSGLLQQFLELRQATALPLPPKRNFDANMERNRYKDVLCTDKTRVVLKWPPDASSDYIHANWVDFKNERKFICTQAPIESSIDDFWRLIWQEKCKAIVMLCELVEQNKKKCESYWPVELNEVMHTKSGLTIRNSNIGLLDSMTITTLDITYSDENGPETLSIKHIKWNNWPDRGVPENRIAPFRLICRLKNAQPIVIHCSAGIGRTGTIVGLHMALQVLSDGEDLVLSDVVKELRAQRHGSVQTDAQFVFMHVSLLTVAENKSLVTAEELEKFLQDYDTFVKLRGG